MQYTSLFNVGVLDINVLIIEFPDTKHVELHYKLAS